eukprot:Rhum_TRINITY_DN14630_c12_g2::Rhum_TRINITY_DN14630_c12_g2_i1::g.105401::m.105401
MHGPCRRSHGLITLLSLSQLQSSQRRVKQLLQPRQDGDARSRVRVQLVHAVSREDRQPDGRIEAVQAVHQRLKRDVLLRVVREHLLQRLLQGRLVRRQPCGHRDVQPGVIQLQLLEVPHHRVGNRAVVADQRQREGPATALAHNGDGHLAAVGDAAGDGERVAQHVDALNGDGQRVVLGLHRRDDVALLDAGKVRGSARHHARDRQRVRVEVEPHRTLPGSVLLVVHMGNRPLLLLPLLRRLRVQLVLRLEEVVLHLQLLGVGADARQQQRQLVAALLQRRRPVDQARPLALEGGALLRQLRGGRHRLLARLGVADALLGQLVAQLRHPLLLLLLRALQACLEVSGGVLGVAQARLPLRGVALHGAAQVGGEVGAGHQLVLQLVDLAVEGGLDLARRVALRVLHAARRVQLLAELLAHAQLAVLHRGAEGRFGLDATVLLTLKLGLQFLGALLEQDCVFVCVVQLNLQLNGSLPLLRHLCLQVAVRRGAGVARLHARNHRGFAFVRRRALRRRRRRRPLLLLTALSLRRLRRHPRTSGPCLQQLHQAVQAPVFLPHRRHLRERRVPRAADTLRLHARRLRLRPRPLHLHTRRLRVGARRVGLRRD